MYEYFVLNDHCVVMVDMVGMVGSLEVEWKEAVHLMDERYFLLPLCCLPIFLVRQGISFSFQHRKLTEVAKLPFYFTIFYKVLHITRVVASFLCTQL